MIAVLRFVSIVGLAGYVFLLPPPGAAQDNYPAVISPESAKLSLLEAMQRNEKTRLFFVAPPEHTEEQRNWCQRFLADLETGGAITMVEPAARSERYNDPVFQPWRKSCPTLAMNAKLGYSPLVLHDEYPQLPFHMSDGRPLDGYEYGTRNFKLYVTDIDNNPKNGEEVVFYSERAYSYWEAILKAPGFKLALPPVDANWNDILPPEKAPAMSTYWGSNYKMLRSPACLASDVLSPADPYDYRTDQPLSTLNGVLAYRGKTYLFTWQPEQQEIWEFRLIEVNPYTIDPWPKVTFHCAFR